MKKKQPEGVFKLQVASQQANPSPPVGPACGQRGLNIMEVCKKINDECKKLKDVNPGDTVPAIITYYKDKKFDVKIGKPSVSNLVKKSMKIKSGSKKPGIDSAGKISSVKVKEIAEMKMEEMGVANVESAIKQVEGTCRSMGITVEG